MFAACSSEARSANAYIPAAAALVDAGAAGEAWLAATRVWGLAPGPGEGGRADTLVCVWGDAPALASVLAPEVCPAPVALLAARAIVAGSASAHVLATSGRFAQAAVIADVGSSAGVNALTGGASETCRWEAVSRTGVKSRVSRKVPSNKLRGTDGKWDLR